ncbi:MAG: low molecular weight phosphotyrosine protein phosphatase, partial [Wenzhouxiangellaceae bacterium]
MSERLLFVCMGNICRSPTAKGVFDRALSRAGVEFESESAGTHGYHVGQPPDRRAIEAAARAGIDISGDISR